MLSAVFCYGQEGCRFPWCTADTLGTATTRFKFDLPAVSTNGVIQSVKPRDETLSPPEETQ